MNISLLSRKSKCSKKALNKIVKKGMGAYYSSGSRPNQTAHSWGYARLYSALAGGPAAKVDMHILKEGCKKSSKSLKLAKNPRKNTTRKKVQLGGYRMKERIVKFERSPIRYKKYRAFVRDLKTGKVRHIDFGDNRYQQYKDKIGIYSHLDHNDKERRKRYYDRHGDKNTKNKESAKYWSHKILW